MTHLKVAFKNDKKIKAFQDREENTLGKIIWANHEKRELKKLLKKQAQATKK